MPGTKSSVSDQEFLFMAVKLSGNVKFDFQKIGDNLGITSHSAYCRWNKIKKQFEAEGGTVTTATDVETPKRKRAAPKKKSKKDSAAEEDDDDVEESPSKKGKASGTEDIEVKKGLSALDDLLAGGEEDDVF